VYNRLYDKDNKSSIIQGVWTHKSFRPLTTLSFRLNYWLSGYKMLTTTAFHATNVMLHWASSLVMGWLAYSVLRLSAFWSIATVTLFAVHPVHTESVHYIVGRADILALLCYVPAVCIYSKSYSPFHRKLHWEGAVIDAIGHALQLVLSWVGIDISEDPSKKKKGGEVKAPIQPQVNEEEETSDLVDSQLAFEDEGLSSVEYPFSNGSRTPSFLRKLARQLRFEMMGIVVDPVEGVMSSGGLIALLVLAIVGGLCKVGIYIAMHTAHTYIYIVRA
jgi:hypothetical protein